jgi:hypothetical protein
LPHLVGVATLGGSLVGLVIGGLVRTERWSRVSLAP